MPRTPLTLEQRRARERARRILDGALARADPAACVDRHLAIDDAAILVDRARVEAGGRIRLVAAGKAAAAMARAACQRLGDRIERGLLVVPAGSSESWSPPALEVIVAGHPLPDRASLRAGAMALELAADLGPSDMLLCLISGGASALLEHPRAGIDGARLTELAAEGMRAGWPIERLNRERACLSALKAGGLARAAGPARVIGLLLSDVVGDDPAVIGSGPTVLDDGDRVCNVVVGDNRLLLDGAAEAAEGLGFEPVVLGRSWTGEAREWGSLLARIAIGLTGSGAHALLAAGETTVTVTGPGRGGRNQEVALGAALTLDGVSGVCLASTGSDGVDGPSGAAGAVADGRSVARARVAGVDARAALDRNDSWTFFHAIGDHLITGPTGTNLMDLQIALVGSPD